MLNMKDKFIGMLMLIYTYALYFEIDILLI